MTLKEVNLEENFLGAEDALSYLKQVVTNAKRNKVGCVYVIHGYGSSGKGGIIRQKARQWLNAQLRNGKIKTVIFGENFTLFNPQALEIKRKFPILNQLLCVCNHGVTIVEI